MPGSAASLRVVFTHHQSMLVEVDDWWNTLGHMGEDGWELINADYAPASPPFKAEERELWLKKAHSDPPDDPET